MPIYGNGVPNGLRRMPDNQLAVRIAPRTIRELLMSLDAFQLNEASVRATYPWASRFVMGLPLAPWQRPLVWSEAQMARFVTSLWQNIDAGAYLINDRLEFVTSDTGAVSMALFADMVLDGQQRLTALEYYFLDKIAVLDKDGIPVKWSELSLIEQRLFANRTFSRGTISSSDEAELRRVYDLLAFGGVAHLPSERAST